MKMHLIETWGIGLGWCVWMLGGWLVFDATGKVVEWTWHYTNVRELLENYWMDKAAGQRVPTWT